jgi:hypothetical protein
MNPNPEVEGYSYVNLVLMKNLGAGAATTTPTRRRVVDFPDLARVRDG